MQTQLSIKHLGYGLAPLTLLMAFGFLSSSEHGSITGGVVCLLLFAACIGMIRLGRAMERARDRWTRLDPLDRDRRFDDAMALVRQDPALAAAKLDRALRVASIAPTAMIVLAWGALAFLSVSLLGVWTVILAFPLMRSTWGRIQSYREGLRDARDLGPDETAAVTMADAPALFETIRAYSRQFGVAPPEEVRFSPAPTAYVFERPFGEHARVLVIGLPLLYVLSEPQLQAVIAHEIAHLANDDVDRSRRAWAARRRLQCVHEALDRRGLQSPLLRTVTLWAMDRINPLDFALARRAEISADATSARVLGARQTADALMYTYLLDLDREAAAHEFMARYGSAATSPPSGFVAHMTQAAQQRFEPTRMRAELLRLLCQPTTIEDEHPALRDRIEQVGAPLDFSSPGFAARIDERVMSLVRDASTTPASSWLAGGGTAIVERVDNAWRRAASKSWEQLRFLWNDRQARVQQQEQDVARGIRTPWLAFERARIIKLTHGDAEALPWLEHAVQLDPENAPIQYSLGMARYRLGRGDCEDPLITARMLDPASARAVLPVLAAMRFLRDDPVGGQAYVQAALERRRDEVRAADERERSIDSNDFRPVRLDELRARRLVELLWSLNAVSAAHLAQVPVRILPEEPCFAIALTIADNAAPIDVHQTIRAVLDCMTEMSHGVERVIVYTHEAPNGRRIAAVTDSLVFTRIAAGDYQRLVA